MNSWYQNSTEIKIGRGRSETVKKQKKQIKTVSEMEREQNNVYYNYSQSQHCDTYITASITYQFHNPSTLLIIHIHI